MDLKSSIMNNLLIHVFNFLALPLEGNGIDCIGVNDMSKCVLHVLKRHHHFVFKTIGLTVERLTAEEMAATFQEYIEDKVFIAPDVSDPPPATDSGRTARTPLYPPATRSLLTSSSPSLPPFFCSLSQTEEPAKAGTYARDRRALQQLALNVHVKHSDLT